MNKIILGPIGFVAGTSAFVYGCYGIINWDNRTFAIHEGNPFFVRFGGFIIALIGLSVLKAESLIISLGALV